MPSHQSSYRTVSKPLSSPSDPGPSTPQGSRYGKHLEVPGQFISRSGSSSHSTSSSRPPSTSSTSTASSHTLADSGFRPFDAHLQSSSSKSQTSSRGPASTSTHPPSAHPSSASHGPSSIIPYRDSNAYRPSHKPTYSPSSYRPKPLSPSYPSSHYSPFTPTRPTPSSHSLIPAPSRVPSGALAHTHDPRGSGGPGGPGGVSLAWKTAGMEALAPLAVGEEREVIEFVETKVRRVVQKRGV